MGYYWGGKWHDEPEPVESIAQRAAKQALETGQKVTITTGRVRVSATPSGRVVVREEGVGSSGGTISPQTPSRESEVPVDPMVQEATVSREELEELTGKRYAGLKERVPKWQAEAILKQEGFVVREVATETGTRKLVAVKKQPSPRVDTTGEPVQTPTAKFADRMTQAVLAQRYYYNPMGRLEYVMTRAVMAQRGYEAQRRELGGSLSAVTVKRPYGARPVTPTMSPEWREYWREEQEIMAETMRGAVEVGGALAIGGATGVGLRLLAGISTKAATAAGAGIAGYSVYDYGKRMLRNVREGDVGGALYETSLFALAGAGAVKGFRAAEGYVTRVKEYAAARGELKKYPTTYREYPNPVLERQARIEHVLESFMPRGQAQRLGAFLREERGELLLKLEKKPLKPRSDVVDMTNIRYDREYDFLYDVGKRLEKTTRPRTEYPDTVIGRTGMERIRTPRRFREVREAKQTSRLFRPAVVPVPDVSQQNGQGLNVGAEKKIFEKQGGRQHLIEEQFDRQFDLLTPWWQQLQLEEQLTAETGVQEPALRRPQPRRQAPPPEVDINLPDIPPDIIEEPIRKPPGSSLKFSFDVDIIDLEDSNRGRGYNPYTFRNPWAEPEDMLSILFGGGGSGGGGSRRRKRRRRK